MDISFLAFLIQNFTDYPSMHARETKVAQTFTDAISMPTIDQVDPDFPKCPQHACTIDQGGPDSHRCSQHACPQ
eukprot:1148569-Pelagomonas_calceolata.AAC.2